jgi:hypothetical protein
MTYDTRSRFDSGWFVFSLIQVKHFSYVILCIYVFMIFDVVLHAVIGDGKWRKQRT